MDKETEINFLRMERQSIQEQMSPLTKRLSEIRQRILELKSQFKIGDRIQWSSGRGMLFGRVECIGAWMEESPQWRVIRIKNDGTDGAEVWVRSYNNPVLCEESARVKEGVLP